MSITRPAVDQFLRDLRFAFRAYRRRPTLAFVAVATLAVGVGANVAVFSVVRAVLMTDMPYTDPDRLVVLSKAGIGPLPESLSQKEYEAVRDSSSVYEKIAACASDMSPARGLGDAENIVVSRVTPDFFSVFGVSPLVGRAFGPADFTSGERVAVISFDLWVSQFNQVRDVLGREIRLNREPWTVIGVMPATFRWACGRGSGIRTVLVPLVSTYGGPRQKTARSVPVMVFARLGRHGTLATARRELAAVLTRLPGEHGPSASVGQIDRVGEREAAAVRPGLLMLQGIAAFLLLIVCANLANLLLAHATARSREVALRLMLGAERHHVVRQLLTEAVALSTLGAITGVAIAYCTVPVLVRVAAPALPPGAAIRVTVPELAVGLGLGWLTSMVFGAAPALMLARIDARDFLRGGGHVTSGRAIRTLRATLISAEVLLAVVVFDCTGALVRSFVSIAALPIGFDSRGLAIAEFSGPPGPASWADYLLFNRRLEVELRARLGGRAMTCASAGPFSRGGTTEWWLRAPGGTDERRVPYAEVRAVSSDYFDVLRIPVVQGRLFSSERFGDRERAAIVNHRFASRYAPGQSILGSQVRWGTFEPFTVVGVVQDTRSVRLSFVPFPSVYVPLDLLPSPRLAVAVRATDLGAVSAALHEAARAIDPDLVVTDVVSADADVWRRESTRYFYLSMMSLLAGLSGLLAGVGISGVVAHVTSLRVREFGVRIAFGASPANLYQLVIGQGLRPVAAGLVGGVIASWWIEGFLSVNKVFMAQLYATKPRDLSTLATAVAALLVIAAVACWLPARRAARVDPASVLRID